MTFEELLELMDRRVPVTMERVFESKKLGDFDHFAAAVKRKRTPVESDRDMWRSFAGAIEAKLDRGNKR